MQIKKKGKIKKTSNWNLKPGYYSDGQFIYEYLNENQSLETGTWKINIYIKKFNRINKFLFEQKEIVIIEYKFIVVPSQNRLQFEFFKNNQNITNDYLDKYNYKKYFQLTEICTYFINNSYENKINVSRNNFLNCSETYWSTYYPDPKSNLNNIYKFL